MNDSLKRMLGAIPGLGMVAAVLTVVVTLADRKPQALLKERADVTAVAKEPEPAKQADAPGEVTPGHLDFLFKKNVLKRKYPPASRPFSPGESKGIGADPFAQSAWKLPAIEPTDTDFLIVTVPDPDETQLGVWFDQVLEAVNRGMIADGDFGLHLHWLPWKLGRPVAPGVPSKEPGVVVFRNKSDYRIVLLVGENPVNGVHPEAMAEALKLVHGAKGNSESPFQILGPFSTGGFDSIVKAVDKFRFSRLEIPGGLPDFIGPFISEVVQPRYHFNLFSGSATGIEVRKAHPAITVRSTQVPEVLLRNALFDYLKQPGGYNSSGEVTKADPFTKDFPVEQVAYLIESNSGFGMTFKKELDAERKNNKLPWTLKFPMHISKLVGMESQVRREHDVRLGLAPTEGERLTQLDEKRGGSDILPSADEPRTALINKRLLEDYWYIIRRERVKYVGVYATDTRDAIFLIEQLRRECPNAQPFLTVSDLHFGHPEYLQTMRGVLISSTYPLNPNLQ